MTRIPRCHATEVLAFLAAITFAPGAHAAATVVLDVPQLAAAGSARGFEFTSFQFNLYLVPVGVPDTEESDLDYAANVLANDDENYTYEHAAASGSGRGGGYHPPRYVRGPGHTYSATYQNVTSPPGELDAFFHFSGADVAGMPLEATVLDSGTYSLSLTADADGTHSPIALGTPLSNGLYTLEYMTDSLLGSQITLTSGVALPGDYNRDGIVDSADYAVWRNNVGAPAGTLPNDSVGGVIGQTQYDTWKANFGRSSGSGSLSSAAVPEPASGLLIILAAACWALGSTSRRINNS